MATNTQREIGQISWEIAPEDLAIVKKIVDRAAALYKREHILRDKIDIQMDIEACHLNGCPLRLADMLEADDFNFMHDVDGIANCISHDTGRLTKNFLPRFAAPQR